MGRELRRVPLDFEWPLNKVWRGFVNPLYTAVPCSHCEGSGSSPTARHLKDQWYGKAAFRPEDRDSVPFAADHPAIAALARRNSLPNEALHWPGCNADREARRLADMFNRQWMHHLNDGDVAALLKADRLRDFTHTFVPGKGWQSREPLQVPAAAEVNAWSLAGLGHDSINQWIVVNAECERLGSDPKCRYCDGHGETWPSEDARQAYESWERTEPPAGGGYQIWETVSEGSPISPVFDTPEALARHMAGTKWGGDSGTPYETWLRFILGPGWSLSMVVHGGRVMNGVEAAALARADESHHG